MPEKISASPVDEKDQTAAASGSGIDSETDEQPLAGIAVSEPEDALPRVSLGDLPGPMQEACAARAGKA